MPKTKATWAKLIASALVIMAAGVLVVAYERAAHLKRVRGAWEGALHFHVGSRLRTQRIVLHISEQNGKYQAVFDEIDLGRNHTRATRFQIGRRAVDFSLASGFHYRGSLNADATEITGRWRWPGTTYSQPLALERTTAPDPAPEPLAEADYAPRPDSDLQGLWQGTLVIGTNSLRLLLKIAEGPIGAFRAEVNSLDQRPVLPVPVTAMEYREPHLEFHVQGVGAVFNGVVNDNHSQITGQWAQVLTTPVTFVRASNAPSRAEAKNPPP